MNVKDLNQETIDKISLPDEDEIEDDVHRVFLGLEAIEEYFIDMGLDPEEVYDAMAYFCIFTFCMNAKDLEFARQRLMVHMERGLDRSLEEKKKVQETSNVHQADFFSIFLTKDGKPTFQ